MHRPLISIALWAPTAGQIVLIGAAAPGHASTQATT